MINDKSCEFCKKNNLLAPTQHGFRTCETALATIMNYISDNLDGGTSTNLVQLDFSTTFNTPDHIAFLQKVAEAGVRSPLLTWMVCFLTGRKHQVLFHGSRSKSYAVTAELMQGSVLILLVHQQSTLIEQHSHDPVGWYADDTNLLAQTSLKASCSSLQAHLSVAQQWWCLELSCFNPSKCAATLISQTHNPAAPTTICLTSLSLPLQCRLSVRHLPRTCPPHILATLSLRPGVSWDSRHG